LKHNITYNDELNQCGGIPTFLKWVGGSRSPVTFSTFNFDLNPLDGTDCAAIKERTQQKVMESVGEVQGE
jgi:hypothetical protein